MASWTSHHFGSLGPSYGKLQIRILFPVSEEQRELAEESVVDIADGGDCL